MYEEYDNQALLDWNRRDTLEALQQKPIQKQEPLKVSMQINYNEKQQFNSFKPEVKANSSQQTKNSFRRATLSSIELEVEIAKTWKETNIHDRIWMLEGILDHTHGASKPYVESLIRKNKAKL
jgi:hypothetical protein